MEKNPKSRAEDMIGICRPCRRSFSLEKTWHIISTNGHRLAISQPCWRYVGKNMLLERVGPCAEWGYFELATIACSRMDIDELLASAERALEIALEFNDPDLEAQALADFGLALVTKGRTAEGMARLDAALAAISAGEVSPTAAGICYCSMLTA